MRTYLGLMLLVVGVGGAAWSHGSGMTLPAADAAASAKKSGTAAYTLTWYVIGSGGLTRSLNTPYMYRGTIGQGDAAWRQSSTMRLSSGFWLPAGYGPSSQAGPPKETLPTEYALHQNYPNPFNPTTVIKYELPQAGDVKLVIYDLLGREVRVLVDEKKAAGVYEIHFDAMGLSSGFYFYRLQAGNYIATKKLLILK
jgi:hypothetical protein